MVADPNDIVGKRFGLLTVISVLPDRHGYVYYYRCKCDCGNYSEVSRYRLKTEIGLGIKSCGCIKNNFDPTDFIGKTYGALTVISVLNYKAGRHRWVKCRCQCGKTVSRIIKKLGINSSCGCTKGSISKTHGESRVHLYALWNHINHHNKSLGYVYPGWDTYIKFKTWCNDNCFDIDKNTLLTRVSGDIYNPQTTISGNRSDALKKNPPQLGKSCKYKGVYFISQFAHSIKPFMCSAGHNKKPIYIGRFSDPIAAALSYDDVVVDHCPETAWLNRDHFPEVMARYVEERLETTDQAVRRVINQQPKAL